MANTVLRRGFIVAASVLLASTAIFCLSSSTVLESLTISTVCPAYVNVTSTGSVSITKPAGAFVSVNT